MCRIGYDADSQTYTFRDSKGTLYTGPEGARYGELKKGKAKSFAYNYFPLL
jgi:hypothetical protein